MGEWEPDDTAVVDEPCERWCKALFWIVPARVGGRWRTSRGDLVLTQTFQFVSGTLGKDPIADGRLRGEQISFNAAGVTYTGRVSDYRMSGTAVVDGRTTEWNAVRR
jgi:hypothetical protein